MSGAPFVVESKKTIKPEENIGYLRQIREGRNVIDEEEYNTGMYSQYGLYGGEQPEVSFAFCIYAFERTSRLQHPVNNFVSSILGTELQVNADDKNAKKILEDWNAYTNFFEKLLSVLTTTFICGAGLLEKTGKGSMFNFEPVDMRVIIGKNRDKTGNLKSYYYRTAEGRLDELDAKKYIEFGLTDYSKTSWGRSLFYSLLLKKTLSNGDIVPSVLEMWWDTVYSSYSILKNNASPTTFLTYEGASKDFLEKKAHELKKRTPGSWWIGDRKPELDIFEADSQTKYQEIIKLLQVEMDLGTQWPSDIMTGDFTSRASSDVTSSILDKRVRGFQRYIVNKIMKEIYEPILIQNNIDPQKANISISFTTPNIIELQPADVVNRVQAGIWTKEEAREWDKDNLGVDLFDDVNDDVELLSKRTTNDIDNEDTNPKQMEEEAIKTYKMIQEEIKKTRIKERAKQIKKNLKDES